MPHNCVLLNVPNKIGVPECQSAKMEPYRKELEEKGGVEKNLPIGKMTMFSLSAEA